MIYQTRHLVALTDVVHGGAYVAKGEQFPATPVDATYLVEKGKARLADPQPPAFVAPVRRRGGRVAAKTGEQQQEQQTQAAGDAVDPAGGEHIGGDADPSGQAPSGDQASLA